MLGVLLEAALDNVVGGLPEGRLVLSNHFVNKSHDFVDLPGLARVGMSGLLGCILNIVAQIIPVVVHIVLFLHLVELHRLLNSLIFLGLIHRIGLFAYVLRSEFKILFLLLICENATRERDTLPSDLGSPRFNEFNGL